MLPNEKELPAGARYPKPARNSGPVIRRFRLPNGRVLVSIRPDVFRRALDAANRALRGTQRPKSPHHLTPCSCGWRISAPKLVHDRSEAGNRIIGYRIYCVGCARSTGFRQTQDEAIDAWERFAGG